MAEDVTPFRLVPPKNKKPRLKSNGGSGGGPPDDSAWQPKEPKWYPKENFPEDSAAILKKSRISKRQFSRYAEQVLLFLVTHGSADFTKSLLEQVHWGEKEGMKVFAQILGLVKNESAVTVNLHQNNNLSIESPQEARDFDSIVRQLDTRDRKAGSIETTAIPILDRAEEIEKIGE